MGLIAQLLLDCRLEVFWCRAGLFHQEGVTRLTTSDPQQKDLPIYSMMR
jgi:hypothetical protein